MKRAYLEITEPPDVMDVARLRIVLHTPGQPMTTMFWRGKTDNVVRELLAAGYALHTERATA